MRLNKNQLDLAGTILGVIAGIATVLTTNQVIDQKIGGSISGVATVLLGIVVQRPTDEAPTTEDVEEEKVKEHQV